MNHRSDAPKPRLLGAFLCVTLILASCGGGGFEADDVVVNTVSATEPGTNKLMIPDLLEPTIVDGVHRFDLSLGASSHDFGNGTAILMTS